MYIAPTPALCTHLKPICPRDGHVMRYQWAESAANPSFEPSYHCGLQGCSVRYNGRDGYFILHGLRNHTYAIQEPAANTLRCPIHNHWLHRTLDRSAATGARLWRCGVKDCSFLHEFSVTVYRSNLTLPLAE
jgi:hypothetical protein